MNQSTNELQKDNQEVDLGKSITDLVMENQNVDNFICIICHDFSIDPLECNQCHHIFCSACILQWLKNKDQCPFKCPSQPMVLLNLSEVKQNSIQNIRLHCQNKEYGCLQEFNIQTLEPHQNNCYYKPYRCQHENCGNLFIKADLTDHEINCPCRLVACLKCNHYFMYKVQDNHECIISMNQTIESQKAQLSKQEAIIQKLNQKLAALSQKLQSLTYICPTKHPLKWVAPVIGIKCDQCKQPQQVCRYVCEECQLFFCQKCMPAVVQENKCPLNHILEEKDQFNRTILCDLCEQRVYDLGVSIWSDRACNFDICSNCYQKMHEI